VHDGERLRMDILEFVRQTHHAYYQELFRRQLPRLCQKVYNFRVKEWEGKPWVVAFMPDSADKYTMRSDRTYSAELRAGVRRYNNCIIERSVLSDDLISLLALMA
jgi:hypothetical protein